jgi:nickel/cobalt transporter (NicO) family protein
MTRLGLALLCAVALAPRADAHQLDEYLQAARLDISRDRIAVELDLTPGISIAPQIIALIDTDGDGVISDAEMTGYARQVLRELSLWIDDRPSSLTLTRAAFPAWADVREGLGTIRLEAVATTGVAHSGPHQIVYENGHQPETSVYLVNALKPSAGDIVIGDQHRDIRQHRLALEVEVSGSRERVAWCASASLVFVWYTLRRRWSRPPGRSSEGLIGA